jgi:hypothetical protein
MKSLRIAVALALVLSLTPITEAQASECGEPTLAPSSPEPTLLTIIDTEVGTEAFERLVTYSNGGHSALGKAIAQAHQWFAVCEYVGVGIGSGSGGNGYRPNFMLALWRDGIDIALARSAVYQLVGASSNPVVTNGDCAIACDGTIDGVAPTTTTTTVATTTTTIATTTTTIPTTTTTVAVSETAEPTTMSEPVAESEPVATETATTTTTTIPVVASAGVSISLAPVKVAPKKPVATKKQPKKPVKKKLPPKKRTVKK